MAEQGALYGGLEGGGTKFVCAVGSGPDDLRALRTIPTTTREETLAEAAAFFREAHREFGLKAIGVGTFGPLDLNPQSETFGRLTTTPKKGWPGTDIAGEVGGAIGVPTAIDSDVNAALAGERRWGAASDVSNAVYLTVGTGIGGGAMANGEIVHGMLHTEMGHMHVPRIPEDAGFAGVCPNHGDCLEGLASGPSMAKRWSVRAEELPDGHPAWDMEARYLAYGVAAITYVLSPERIIIGGGVSRREALLPLVRSHFRRILNGFLAPLDSAEVLDGYIVRPALGDRAGVLGAIALAMGAAEASEGL